MKKKGLAVAVILLFIGVAFTSSINATDKEINDDIIEPLDIGRFMVRGFGLFPHYHGDNFTFFALRCHYITITGTSRTTGTFHFRWISIPKPCLGFIKYGLFRISFYFIFHSFKSDEIPDNLMRLNNQMRIGS